MFYFMKYFFIVSIILFIKIICVLCEEDYKRGHMTWYSPDSSDDDNYEIACSNQMLTSKSIGVALHENYIRKKCFECIEIKCLGIKRDNKTIYQNKCVKDIIKVKVFDQNGAAKNRNHVDATKPLFLKLLKDVSDDKKLDYGEIDIEWRFTNCEGSLNHNLRNNGKLRIFD